MEVAAAAAGFVSLTFNTFQSCVQAFDFVYTAQHIGVDGDLFATRLQWEQYRLLQWGTKAGLGPGLSPSSQLNWQITCALLTQLEALLTSAEELKSRYRLDVAEEVVGAREQAIAAQPPTKGVAKFIARLKPEVYTIRGQIIQANNTVIKRLRWATVGKDQANAITKDISDLNTRLHQLLDTVEQDRRTQVDAILLRDILSRSSTATEVEEIQYVLGPHPSTSTEAIKAAATLKQIRLYIGDEARDDEVKTTWSKELTASMPSLKKYKHKRLAPYSTQAPLRYQGLEFARYNSQPVLVEWKVAEGAMWKRMFDQVTHLALMLASPAGKNSQSLLCLGYLPWEERELYALVYEIPAAASNAKDVANAWELRSLHSLISAQPHLSLDRRFAIAKTMAGVVLQLHTAGWLHKSLRSENIVFLCPQGSTASEFLHSPPFLVGYEYARLDTTQGAVFTQLPDTEVTADLYRHPKARGVGREKYRTQFDVYALGCILMELGLWRQLVDVKTTYVDPSLGGKIKEATAQNREVDLPSLLELSSNNMLVQQLRHSVGEAFADAIVTCISMEPPTEDASLDVQQAVVETLHRCKC
jgi:hypothetical protein